jgi:hypothetical protein
MILELLIGAGAVLLIGKAVGFAKDSEKLVVDTKARVHKITFSRITIVVKATVKNPTKHNYKFKHPFVTLLYKNESIGTSLVESTDYELKPFEQRMLNDITVEISVLSLPTLALDLFNILRTQTGAAPILIRTTVPVEVAGQITTAVYEQTVNL